MILRAIKETVACHENPQQIGFVADKLPADFDLSDAELDDALRELKLKGPESLAAPELPAAQVGDAPAETEGSPRHRRRPSPTTRPRPSFPPTSAGRRRKGS